jgi:hypothetical protein
LHVGFEREKFSSSGLLTYCRELRPKARLPLKRRAVFEGQEPFGRLHHAPVAVKVADGEQSQ